MGSSPLPNDRLTKLQRELVVAFFEREQRLFLTGGAALAGFYFAHRETEDLDLFGGPGLDLQEASRVLDQIAASCGATTSAVQTFPDFRRLLVTRGEEQCKVDLVIDRAPMIDAEKATFGRVRVDTLREIAANKICTLLGRSEVKDLLDLKSLREAGVDLDRALVDAERKDGGVDPATLAWILEQLSIGPEAILPGGIAPADLLAFRDDLVRVLRATAFERAKHR